MTDKKHFFPLKLKMFCVLLLLTGLAVGVYYLGNNIGYSTVVSQYMTEDASAARVRLYTAKFQSYVAKNDLSSKDLNAIAAWTKETKYVHLLIFKGGEPRAEAGSWGANSLIGSRSEKYYEAVGDSISFTPVKFSDGTFRVSLDEYSYTKYYTLCDVSALILAFAVLIGGLIIYESRMTRRITTLSAAAQKIEKGDLDCVVPVSGRDELSRLAGGMNSMRMSVKERIRSETAARQANGDLIAAISHDIRTPLTTLIGYLELLQNGAYSSDEQLKLYVDVAYEKSMRLKELTDELFSYFLVFDQSDIPVKIEEFDAQILMEQLLGEQIIELKNSGQRVITKELDESCVVMADVMYLKRVVDNVFSNVKKHSDIEKPVMVMVQMESDGRVHICISDSIPPVPNKVESTRIGLKTCEKLMKVMNGEFKTLAEGNKFMSELIVPVKQQKIEG